MSREQIEAALYDHREDALTCYDHPPTVDAPSWCCVCGEHGLTVSWRAHVAEVISSEVQPRRALREAGVSVEQIKAALVEAIVDDPMWIGDDGQPLDYLPEREARIADFVHRAAEVIAALMPEAS